MYLFIFIILFFAIGAWLLISSGKGKKKSWPDTDHREAQPFVFSNDKPFVHSRNKEKSELNASEKKASETRPFQVIQPGTKKPEIKKPQTTDSIKAREIKEPDSKPQSNLQEGKPQQRNVQEAKPQINTAPKKSEIPEKPQPAAKQESLAKQDQNPEDLPLETIIIPADKEDTEIDFDHLSELIDEFFGDGIDLENSK